MVEYTFSAALTGNAIGTGTGPFFPSAESRATIIQSTASLSSVFGDNSTHVIGRPAVTDASVTLTSANAPYIYNATSGEWERNTASPVILDDNGDPIITERMVVRVPDSTAATSLVTGSGCMPVFYGVDFIFDEGGTSPAALRTHFLDNATAAFYNCSFVHNANGISEIRSPRVLFRGWNVRHLGVSGDGAEWFQPMDTAPQRFSVSTPNFPDWSVYPMISNLGGDVGAVTALNTDLNDQRQYYSGFSICSFMTWTGLNTTAITGDTGAYRNNDKGTVLNNAIGSPVPFVETALTDITANVATAPLTATNITDANDNNVFPAPVQSKAFFANQGSFGGWFGDTALTGFQTLTLNFDRAGYTLRLRREEVRVYTHTGGNTGGGSITAADTNSRFVEFDGFSKRSNGFLLRNTTDARISTTPQLGDGTQRVTDATGEVNWGAFLTSQSPEDIQVFDGYDDQNSPMSTTVQVPAWMQTYEGDPGSGSDKPILFFRWTLIAQHDETGTFTRELNFLPGELNIEAHNSGNNEVIEINVAEDVSFLSTRNLNTGGAAIADSQHLYDALKTYVRIRDSGTDYDTSHLNSEVPYFTMGADGRVDIGSRDIVAITSGRLVTVTDTTVSLRLADVGTYTAGNLTEGSLFTGITTTGDASPLSNRGETVTDENSPVPGDIVVNNSAAVRVDIYNSSTNAVISANVADGTIVNRGAATTVRIVATGSGFLDEILDVTDFTEVVTFTAAESPDQLYASGATAIGGTTIVITPTTGATTFTGFGANTISATDWNRTINDLMKGTANYNEVLVRNGANGSLLNLAGGGIQFNNTVWTMAPATGQGTQFAYWTASGAGTSFGTVTGTGTFTISAPASTDAVQAANQVAGQVDARVSIGLTNYGAPTLDQVQEVSDTQEEAINTNTDTRHGETRAVVEVSNGG